jgi:hypothetical protein
VKSKEKDKDVDYRFQLECLVHDALNFVSKPLWPSSIFILTAFHDVFVEVIHDPHAQPYEMSLRTFALDLVSEVTAKLRELSLINTLPSLFRDGSVRNAGLSPYIVGECKEVARLLRLQVPGRHSDRLPALWRLVPPVLRWRQWRCPPRLEVRRMLVGHLYLSAICLSLFVALLRCTHPSPY